MTVFCVTQGRVVMGTQAVSPYQQVIEKTKNLAFRSQMLVMNIEKKLATKDQEVGGSVEHFGFLACCSWFCEALHRCGHDKMAWSVVQWKYCGSFVVNLVKNQNVLFEGHWSGLFCNQWWTSWPLYMLLLLESECISFACSLHNMKLLISQLCVCCCVFCVVDIAVGSRLATFSKGRTLCAEDDSRRRSTSWHCSDCWTVSAVLHWKLHCSYIKLI